ncbi:hypothetical protein P344_02875 [Spiroplasma mirum ATCC 29335]|uniref:Transmembrane protein n=1 Tax=Spiroplasma mirum ATCC 29335 TaxID=838561 RepID=W0GQU2_9MOLU|nr:MULTISPECIES: hypothetical protein [Spiroplasma]AHF60916.1 hypothetical protein SMM_0483 [Spiroplasma mirum ATCC 29335]AHI57919.1 hypothetical protein P344_02875 [Spiroplasma mirum ATCC 29335]
MGGGGGAVELFFISGVSLFIIICYFTYYYRQYHRCLQTNPAYQTWLNQEFMWIYDWNFVQAKICKILSNYLNSDENINEDYQNHQHILLQLRHKLRSDLDHHQQLEEQENEKEYEE